MKACRYYNIPKKVFSDLPYNLPTKSVYDQVRIGYEYSTNSTHWNDGTPIDYKNFAPQQPDCTYGREFCIPVNFAKWHSKIWHCPVERAASKLTMLLDMQSGDRKVGDRIAMQNEGNCLSHQELGKIVLTSDSPALFRCGVYQKYCGKMC